MSRWAALTSSVVARASRSCASLNIWASSESSSRCASVACSGTSIAKTRLTGAPSGASKGIGAAVRTKAHSGSRIVFTRPCGMATPKPRPVEPSFSRSKRLSKTRARGIWRVFSNSSPICSKRRFLLPASMPSTTWFSGRRRETRFIAVARARALDLRDALDALGVLHVEALLVADHLAVELVDQPVDRRVHVAVVRLHVDVLARHVHVGLDPLVELLHRHHDVHVDHVVEVPIDALELRDDVVADRLGDLDVVTGQVEVHAGISFI